MRRKETLTGIAASVGMLILILDGKTALIGMREGLDLCLKTVVPSLFPFFVLSILLTSSLGRTTLSLLRPVRSLCRIPEGSESILLSGFLGGYPVGAQCIAQSYRSGHLTRQDAERMLGFCSNAGPAFLFGMIAPMFTRKWLTWALWGIHILSAILVSKVLPGSPWSAACPEKEEVSLSQALQTAIHVMAMVCGWVILFRVILSFLKRWVLWFFPIEVQIIFTGILELSNGCCELMQVQEESQRFLICSGILAFGGLCVTMQTAAVTNGLSLRYYLLGKLLQTLFSLLLSGLVLLGNWHVALILLLLFLLLPGKTEKKSSIRAPAGV